MNYCKSCGAEIVKNSESKYTCKSCGDIFYVNPKGGTSLLLLDGEGRLVLGRRAHEPQKGKLDCIGGFVDVGEDFEQAMLRELSEESGLDVDDIQGLEYMGSSYDPYEWQNRVVPVVSVYFKSELVGEKKLVASDDILSFEHLAIKDIKRDDMAWDGMWKMIKKLEAEIDSGQKDRY